MTSLNSKFRLPPSAFRLQKWCVFFLCFVHSLVGYAQQKVTTSYHYHDNLEKLDVYTGLDKFNIVLNGKVKSMTQISYSPDIRCDTLPVTFVDTEYISGEEPHIGGAVLVYQCRCDSTIYQFDDNLSLQTVKKIDFKVSFGGSYLSERDEIVYVFKNGYLTSGRATKNGKIEYETNYKYDSNNNLIQIWRASNVKVYKPLKRDPLLKKITYKQMITKEYLEYDNNNHLVRKADYRYKFYKGFFKTKRKEFLFKKKREPICKKNLHSSEEFEYDTKGHLISKTWNNNERKEIYINDSIGNKIEEGYCANYKGKKCQYIPTQRYLYDENNRFIKSTISYIKGTGYYHNKYDNNGLIIETIGFGIQNKKDTVDRYHFIYEYNEHGQKTREEALIGFLYRAKGIYKVITTTYDEHQNMTQQEFYNSDNQIAMVFRYVYTYDQYGNWIKKEEYEGENEDKLEKIKIIERKFEYYE
jgi:YD repeat-containing protein